MTESRSSAMARFKQFPKTFWVINGIELLERGAYYSLSALFTVFMLATFRGEGMGDGQAAALAGSLGSLLFLLLYLVPLVAAALARKFGYKAMLAVCFALLLGGYVAAFAASGVALIFTAVLLIGFGAGIFKPIAAAVVSETSSEENRNFAFTIYYGCINLGAVIFPLAVGLVGITRPGDLEFLARVAFGTAAGITVVNLLLSLSVYQNLTPPQRDVSILKALKALGEVFKSPSFFILLVIYSGFWFMYAMNLTFITAYMQDFGRMPTWFNTALLQSINPAVIILAAPFIGALTTRINSLLLMSVGIGLYAIGLLTLGWSATSTLFVMGIVIFSIGELLTHPSYLSYVSKIAPPDKVIVYLGYGFIPVAVGLFFGSGIGGALYGTVAVEQGNPALFWSYMAMMGIATVAALLVYNAVMTSRREREAGIVATRRARTMRFVTGPIAALVVLLLIPAMLVGATFAGTTGTDGVTPLADTADLVVVTLDPIEDETAEQEISEVKLTLPETAAGDATFALSWTDEAPATGGTNAPDTFKLHIQLPDGTTFESEESATGTLELKVPSMPGEYTVHVELVDAGDTTVQVGPLAVPASGSADTGNAWTLDVSHQASA